MSVIESDDPCEVLTKPEWTEPEKWVWQETLAGRIADFNERDGEIDPKQPQGWSRTREISPSFLETILTHDCCQKALPRQGVRIVGVWVRQPVALDHVSLPHPLWLEASRIEANMSLLWLKSQSTISFEKSLFIGGLQLNSAEVGGQLTMKGAKCAGKLDMSGLEVGHLSMGEGAEFTDVNLRGAKVRGYLTMNGAKCTGELDMDSIETTGPLLMGEGAEFGDVDLRSAKVGDRLDMGGVRCAGNLNMDAIEISGSLFMRSGAAFKSEVSLTFARIDGQLDVSGAQFVSLDLTNTSVQGELCLGSKEDARPIWQPESRLVLRNTAVSSVRAAGLDGFPKNLYLSGFTYRWLEEFGITGQALQTVSWRHTFVNWLERDGNYSPQPYQHLAAVLRSMGYPDRANTILYEGKERERREMKKRGHRFKWFGLSLLSWTIGYGYGHRYFRSLIWVALFIVIGACVVSTTTIGNTWGTLKTLGFSFDMLIPLVELDENHCKIFSQKIVGPQYYYFFVHKLAGYLLASFVLAGLSGITKK